MTEDKRVVDINADVAKVRAELAEQQARLKGGPPSGTYDPMDGRVSKLEAHMEHVREDMRDIKSTLGTISAKLTELPTKSDLDTWRWQWLATGIGIVALTVGGVTGGLALIARFAG